MYVYYIVPTLGTTFCGGQSRINFFFNLARIISYCCRHNDYILIHNIQINIISYLHNSIILYELRTLLGVSMHTI